MVWVDVLSGRERGKVVRAAMSELQSFGSADVRWSVEMRGRGRTACCLTQRPLEKILRDQLVDVGLAECKGWFVRGG